MERPKHQKQPAPDISRIESTTAALLRQAHDMLADAERRISLQEKRIRELEDLASTDSLTGLMNRRGFERFFGHECARIRRHNSPGGLFVLIDLDRFKEINDTFGHLAGDECLKTVAKHLMASIRILDGAARLGGDEFSLLLTQTDPDKAMIRVRQVGEMLNGTAMEWQGRKIPLGASIGVAPVGAESDYVEAHAAADRALYQDKKIRKSS